MRSVVLKSSLRCAKCLMLLRWCVCEAHRTSACPLAIDLLVHHREQFRPSSTSGLIKRVIPASRPHLWRRERRMTAGEVRLPGRELWILHPRGEPMPSDRVAGDVQVLFLDGSWRETAAMAQEVGGWGRVVSLPTTGESRFWLRAQTDVRRFSTAEALLFLLRWFGLGEAHDVLLHQFELHVYASLRARGHKLEAMAYLAESPIAREFPELLAKLDERRPA
jgi:DTW domain-containing protein